MRTVTICGSMKFETEMQRIAFLLETKHNMNFLQCVYNVDDLDITPMEQITLENAHYRKIELSDAIYVVDIQGYIGNQVSKEIAFAKSKGKEIIFHSAYNWDCPKQKVTQTSCKGQQQSNDFTIIIP